MKSWVFGVLALVLTASAAGTAVACPVGGDDGPRRPIVDRVALGSSQLFERAQRLDELAAARERSATAAEEQAETLASRARALRNQAQFVNVSDRRSVVALAEDLQVRASAQRALASEERMHAASFRAQARALRQRAVQLVRLENGNDNGWHRGDRRAPRPLPNTSASTGGTSI